MHTIRPARLPIRLIAACGACVLAFAVQAQTARSGGGGADNAKALQQMQQLASERTALQADNTKLKDQVDELKKKLDKATAENAGLVARQKALAAGGGSAVADNKKLTEQLENSRAQMQDLITHFRETAQNLKIVETDRNELKTRLESKDGDYKTCVDRNAGLYEINVETLNRLERRGFWSHAADNEPFTQISRAKLENLIDGYRIRVEELRVARDKKQGDATKSPQGAAKSLQSE